MNLPVRWSAFVTLKAGHATLAADHRISDGRRGAIFLAEVDRLLQQPANP